jgi:hypothetical protein
MITTDFIKKIDNARVALSECRTSEEVKEIFSKFEITDYSSKIALLRRCMQIQKIEKTFDNSSSDEAVYKAYLGIFLMGEWRDINQIKESTIPDLDLLSKDVKNQTKGSKTSFNLEEIYDDFDIPKKEYLSFKKFYEMNILPRIQKKYLSQLISVIEDMIDEKIRKQISIDQNKEPRIQKMNRYKIMLTEFTPGLRNKTNALCIVFPHGAIIYYNPNIDITTIRILIAHELGHLLSSYRIISDKDTEKYANLFAFFVINGENNLYTAGNSKNYYCNEMEIIKKIKAVSSVYNNEA